MFQGIANLLGSCYDLGMTKTTGILIYTRKNRSVTAEIVWSRRVYTLVKDLESGNTMRIRTDRLAQGSETPYGHASFRTVA